MKPVKLIILILICVVALPVALIVGMVFGMGYFYTVWLDVIWKKVIDRKE